MAENLKRERDNNMFFDDDEEDTQANKYLSFRIGNEDYGISIKHIIEIIELQRITEVPDMPDYVKGIINLRGKVIPIIELRLRFHMPAREYDDRTCIIVIEINNTSIGVVVDTVEEVLEIQEKNIEPPPKFKNAGVKNKYISGLGKVGENVKILLDVYNIFYEEELESLKHTAVEDRENVLV